MDIFNKIYFLEKKINYFFKNKNILLQSITHKSFNNKINNEKLELLGDSILNMVITNIIYNNFMQLNEGDITKLRSILIKSSTLIKIAYNIEIYNFILVNNKKFILNEYIEDSILEDSIESLIGAIYIDSNSIITTKKFIYSIYKPYLKNINNIIDKNKDFKSNLQKILQKNKILLPTYKIINIKKKLNKYFFLVLCEIKKLYIYSYGYGENKKKAEQIAAKKILIKIKKKYGK